MSSNPLRLPSVERIKRNAKRVRREQSIPHTQALDVAARELGYQNFQHAKNVLADGTTTTNSFASSGRSAGETSPHYPKRWAGGTVRQGAILVMDGSLAHQRWWRPNAIMPPSAHAEAVRLLNDASMWRCVDHDLIPRYLQRIEWMFHTMERWYEQEHPLSKSGRRTHDIYEERYKNLQIRDAPNFHRLRNLLHEHYPDCAPLRKLLDQIDAAAQFVEDNSISSGTSRGPRM